MTAQKPFSVAADVAHRLTTANRARVQIGVMGDYGADQPGDLDDPNATVLDVAYLAEFGRDASASGPEVPAREPLRTTFKREQGKWSTMWLHVVRQHIKDGGPQRQRLVALGTKGFNAVRSTYAAGMAPPLSPVTIAKRRYGGTTPFVDTGATMRSNLAEAIDFEGQVIVVGQGGAR